MASVPSGVNRLYTSRPLAQAPVLLFWPKYRLAHPEIYLFSLPVFFSGSKYPKNILFTFENRSTDEHGNSRARGRRTVEASCYTETRTLLCEMGDMLTSASFLAEISVRSPPKVFIFVI